MSLDSVSLWLATGFGLGHLPGLPGTAGAVLGLFFAVVLDRLPLRRRLLAVIALVLLALPLCEYGWQASGVDDPRIVADEALTLPVATVALPVSRHPALLASVFVVSRILDRLKPAPAQAAEKLHGGIGIVLDDVVSNLWALVLALIGWQWWRRR